MPLLSNRCYRCALPLHGLLAILFQHALHELLGNETFLTEIE